jgi:hypothetical protein
MTIRGRIAPVKAVCVPQWLFGSSLRGPCRDAWKRVDPGLEEVGCCRASASDLTFRQWGLAAAGHNPSGITASDRIVGDMTDMLAVNA